MIFELFITIINIVNYKKKKKKKKKKLSKRRVDASYEKMLTEGHVDFNIQYV